MLSIKQVYGQEGRGELLLAAPAGTSFPQVAPGPPALFSTATGTPIHRDTESPCHLSLSRRRSEAGGKAMLLTRIPGLPPGLETAQLGCFGHPADAEQIGRDPHAGFALESDIHDLVEARLQHAFKTVRKSLSFPEQVLFVALPPAEVCRPLSESARLAKAEAYLLCRGSGDDRG